MFPSIREVPEGKATLTTGGGYYKIRRGVTKFWVPFMVGGHKILDRKIPGLLDRGDHKILRVNFAQFFTLSLP